MSTYETSTPQSSTGQSSSLRPRKAKWFATGVLSLAMVAAGTGTALAATGGSSSPAASHGANHASVGMAHRAGHAKGIAAKGTAGSDAKSATAGGTVARDHSASSCNLPGTTTLSGNWTHGAYVRAAKAADAANVRTAAQGPCGKPMSAHGA